MLKMAKLAAPAVCMVIIMYLALQSTNVDYFDSVDQNKMSDQKSETYAVFQNLASNNDLPDNAVINFQFVPTSKSNLGAFQNEVISIGYETIFIDAAEDSYVEVTTKPVRLNADTIWKHEEKLTEIANNYGFNPDGWGFWGAE